MLVKLGRVHGCREGKREAAWGGWPPKPDQRLTLKLEAWKERGGERRTASDLILPFAKLGGHKLPRIRVQVLKAKPE